MLSSATTVSCYVMARNMGHEGVLTSSVVMLTTLFSAFTLTGWLYILRPREWYKISIFTCVSLYNFALIMLTFSCDG